MTVSRVAGLYGRLFGWYVTVGTSVDGRTLATAVPNPVSHLKIHQERILTRQWSVNSSGAWWEYLLRQLVDLRNEQHRQHSSLWYAWSHRFGVWWFPFKTILQSDPGHREMIGSIQGYSHWYRFFGASARDVVVRFDQMPLQNLIRWLRLVATVSNNCVSHELFFLKPCCVLSEGATSLLKNIRNVVHKVYSYKILILKWFRRYL